MNLKKISFGNFKCLYKASFEPGKVNVFIGANGSGKSTILEGIGLLSAAMTDRVDAASLQRKGVRLSVPALYLSLIHIFLTNNHQGEVILALLCDPLKTAELNRILSQGLIAGNAGRAIEQDAAERDGTPVLFGYSCDLPRITRCLLYTSS